MEYILVNVKLDKERVIELKIPGEIKARELIDMLDEVFHVKAGGKKALHVEPLGRILGDEEVLMDEGVHSGSQISLL